MTNRLSEILDRLEAFYGPPKHPELSDPLHWILLENVAYMVNDEKREIAWKMFRDSIGLSPRQILAAPPSKLRKALEPGGIILDQRVEKMLKIARIAIRDFREDLSPALDLPLSKSMKALQKFPGIGEPGAEKILLFCRKQTLFTVESNGLRVLVRLGFGEEARQYAITYRNVQKAVQPFIRPDFDWLIRAFHLLRRHGQELCKRSHPHCGECPIAPLCPYAKDLRI